MRNNHIIATSEIIPCRKVYSVGVVGLVIEIHSPTMQVLDTKLHIVGDIVEEVSCDILSLTVSTGIRLGITFA